jgi:hypothetical protein
LTRSLAKHGLDGFPRLFRVGVAGRIFTARISEPVTETKQNKLSDQFIRISVEIAANATRFRRSELGAFPPQLKPHAVEYEERKSHSVGGRILSILLFVGSEASGRCLSFLPQPRPMEIMLMRSTKTQEE